MDVVSPGPLRVASLVWQPRPHSFALTVVCRATFQLVPGEAVLAHDQEPPSEEDNHWNDDPSRSLYAPSDLVPFKQRAEVLLVGNAFAPAMAPVRSLLARLVVGDVDKSIEVVAERSFAADGQLREGARFAKMPLRWERAAGGPETRNPVGVRMDVVDSHGATPVPNLQPPGLFIRRRGEPIEPIGFGPIAPTWPGRREKLGRHVNGWPPGGPRGWVEQPFPADIDQAHFNSAPLDQQLSALREDERIVLEHLHPEHPKLVTSLPGLRPRARVERPGGAPEELVLRADTLWIDTDRAICTLTWRGQRTLAHPDEPGRVVVSLERGARGWPEAEGDAMQTMVPLFAPVPTLPFRDAPPGGRPLARGAEIEEISVDEDDHQGSSSPGDAVVHTMFLLPDVTPSGPAPLPFASAKPLPVPPAPPPPPPPPVPPPLMRTPVRMEPVPAPAPSSPWAASAHGPNTPSPPSPPPIDAHRGGIQGERIEPPRVDLGALVARGPEGVAAAASNAAAESEARKKAALSFRPVVELLWLNAGSMPRIRKQPAWKELLAGVKVRPEDEDLEDDLPPPRRTPAKDRREVLAILRKGEALDVEGIEAALLRAMEDEEGFTPPLVLAGGELEMQFDELETLKATIAAASPSLGDDKRLKEVVDRVNEVFKLPWVQGSNSVIEELTGQIREACSPGKRGGATELDRHVERTLLDQRHWQKRTVMGQPRVRALFSSAGSAGKIPVYLPESLGKELPGFRRFGVRLIAEVRGRVDQGESHPAVLRGVAVGKLS